MKNKYLQFILFGFLALPLFVSAQTSLSLSVSPTLFEMTAFPTQQWESSIRVINSNPYDITIYAEAVNFAPQGEGGQGIFIPIDEALDQGQTLAEWISLSDTEIKIPAEQTIEIPFSISVPEDAAPGGHFAALLIGTKPPKTNSGSSQLQTSQIVTSLVFLRVTGDVIEDGVIREFRSVSSIAERPEMGFELRFENKGNVHILPQGEIKIFNMWGEERGVIPVNRQLLFGNVLPNQIRKYTFAWSGEWSIADMGRYRAEAILGYGQNGRKFTDSETYFWVIPWKILAIILSLLVSFVSIMTWAIKLYIRKMLTMSGVVPDSPLQQQKEKKLKVGKVSVVAPIEEGILDLSNRFRDSSGLKQKLSSLIGFALNYKLFFGVVLTVVIFILSIIWYIDNASQAERSYEITIDTDGSGMTISSEQVEYDKIIQNTQHTNGEDTVMLQEIKLVNRSGLNGLAAKLRVDLENNGYKVSDMTSEFGASEGNTVIVYHPNYAKEALELSGLINNALLSSFSEAPEESPIIVYIGKDYQDEVQ